MATVGFKGLIIQVHGVLLLFIISLATSLPLNNLTELMNLPRRTNPLAPVAPLYPVAPTEPVAPVTRQTIEATYLHSVQKKTPTCFFFYIHVWRVDLNKNCSKYT